VLDCILAVICVIGLMVHAMTGGANSMLPSASITTNHCATNRLMTDRVVLSGGQCNRKPRVRDRGRRTIQRRMAAWSSSVAVGDTCLQQHQVVCCSNVCKSAVISSAVSS